MKRLYSFGNIRPHQWETCSIKRPYLSARKSSLVPLEPKVSYSNSLGDYAEIDLIEIVTLLEVHAEQVVEEERTYDLKLFPKILPRKDSPHYISTLDNNIKILEQVDITGDPQIDAKIFDMKHDCLKIMSLALQKPDGIMYLPQKFLNRLFKALQKWLFPSQYLSHVPKSIALDYGAPIANPQWKGLQYAYNLYITLLKAMDFPCFNFKFFIILLRLSGYPDINERLQILALMKLYVDKQPGDINTIVKLVSYQLNLAVSFVNSPFMVTPLLSFLSYTLTKTVIDKALYNYYISGTFPILTTPFYQSVHQFFIVFAAKFASISADYRRDAFNYLKSHWPITAPRKEGCFLEVMTAIIDNTPEREERTYIDDFLEYITKILNGQNYAAIDAALDIINRNPTPAWIIRTLPTIIKRNANTIEVISQTNHSNLISEKAKRIINNLKPLFRKYHLTKEQEKPKLPSSSADRMWIWIDFGISVGYNNDQISNFKKSIAAAYITSNKVPLVPKSISSADSLTSLLSIPGSSSTIPSPPDSPGSHGVVTNLLLKTPQAKYIPIRRNNTGNR